MLTEPKCRSYSGSRTKIVQDCLIKEKLGEAALHQERVNHAPLLIVVCANTSRSIEDMEKEEENL